MGDQVGRAAGSSRGTVAGHLCCRQRKNWMDKNNRCSCTTTAHHRPHGDGWTEIYATDGTASTAKNGNRRSSPGGPGDSGSGQKGAHTTGRQVYARQQDHSEENMRALCVCICVCHTLKSRIVCKFKSFLFQSSLSSTGWSYRYIYMDRNRGHQNCPPSNQDKHVH